jgi:hypothetical protein
LYRVFDEIQKASLKIGDWKEWLLEAEAEKLQRLDYETIIDDQQFRARKLAEVLVDAILFSTTNDELHYADYFLLHELNEYARSQEDRLEFWGFHSKNSEWGAKWVCQEVRDLETAGLDPKTRWYIKDGEALSESWSKRGVPFSSFRARYKKILPIALPSEFNTLGKSYVHAYSGTSKDVHFTPHDTSSNFEPGQIFLGANRVGLLVLALIIRCQLLLGRVPDGINRRYREMHDSNTGPTQLAQSLKTKPADAGDIVWIHGYHAEVLDVAMSKYGYPAYHVRYIEHSPLADVPEDWFAGFEVKLVAQKAMVEKAANGAAEEFQKATGQHVDKGTGLEDAKRAVVRLSIYQQQLRLKTPESGQIASSHASAKQNVQLKADRTEAGTSGQAS